jgi:hypothetical protein
MSEGPRINPDDYDARSADFATEEVPARSRRPRIERNDEEQDSRKYPDGWNPDEAMKALAEEAHILELKPAQQAARLLEEALPLAVAGLVHLSQFGETEKMRFDAQKYLIDRNLGTATKEGDLSALEADPLDLLVGDCVMYVEEADLEAAQANAQSKKEQP